MQSTMSIDLQPEILKSGADSSQTLKLLLRREIQWAHVMWPQVRPAAKKIIEVLKALVAKIERDSEFTKLKVSVWNTPWMPQDEDALANRVQQLTFPSSRRKADVKNSTSSTLTRKNRYRKSRKKSSIVKHTSA